MELGVGRIEARRGIFRCTGVGPRGGSAKDGPGLIAAGRFAGARVRVVFTEGVCGEGVVSGRGGWSLLELELTLGGGGGKWRSRCRVVGLADRTVRRGKVRIGAWAVDRQLIPGCAARVGVMALMGDG